MSDFKISDWTLDDVKQAGAFWLSFFLCLFPVPVVDRWYCKLAGWQAKPDQQRRFFFLRRAMRRDMYALYLFTAPLLLLRAAIATVYACTQALYHLIYAILLRLCVALVLPFILISLFFEVASYAIKSLTNCVSLRIQNRKPRASRIVDLLARMINEGK